MDRPRLRDIAHAGARGVVAAMSMTGVRAVTGGLDIVEEIPPQKLFRQITPRLLKRVPKRKRDAAIEVGHWAYGGVGGAGYALLPGDLRARPWAGPCYGLVIWLGFELGISPVLRLLGPQTPRRARDRVALAADHALYGLVLSEIRPAHKEMR